MERRRESKFKGRDKKEEKKKKGKKDPCAEHEGKYTDRDIETIQV